MSQALHSPPKKETNPPVNNPLSPCIPASIYLVDEELDVVGRDLLAGEVHEVVHVDVHQLRDDVHLVEGRLGGYGR